MSDRLKFVWVFVASIWTACAIAAPDASTVQTSRIAFVGPLTDVPQAPIGKDVLAGMKLYAAVINQAGGIGGRRLEISAYDDKFKPDETVRLAQQSLKEDAPVAFVTIGTAPALAVIQAKLPETLRVPMVPMRTGAGSVREPFNPYVFHIRAGYRQEIEKIASQLLAVGASNIALLYQNDSYGQFGKSVLRTAMERNGKTPVLEVPYDRTVSDLTPIAKTFASGNADAILMVAGGAQSMQFVQIARSLGYKGRIVGVSDVDPRQLINAVGEERARNVGISQVFPSLNNFIAHPLVREFKQHVDRYGGEQLNMNNAVFEGWLTTKVLAEGLKRATSSKRPLKESLESLNTLDLGQYRLSFSPTKHEGSVMVDLLVIGADGRIIY